jgi:hypothetical protein
MDVLPNEPSVVRYRQHLVVERLVEQRDGIGNSEYIPTSDTFAFKNIKCVILLKY